MLILFNTAFRLGYARNILRTLFLPEGAVNEYRYTLGDDLQISDLLLEEIQRKGCCPPVLICFGDRFSSGGYTFFPVRKGRLQSVVKSGGRAYFTVALEEHAAAIDPAAFTKKLYELASARGGNDRLLALTNHDPMCATDGRYAFWCEGEIASFIEDGEHAWRASSGQLAKAHVFRSDAGRQFVFAKCELFVNGRKKKYESGEHLPRFEVERGSDLRLKVHYYYPAQNDDTSASANLSVESSAALQLLGSSVQALDTPESRLEFPFAIESGFERGFANIDLAFSSSANNIDVVGAHEAVSIKIYQPWWWWLVAWAAIGIYLIGAACSASDQKIAGEILKSVAVIVMVVVLGKKLV